MEILQEQKNQRLKQIVCFRNAVLAREDARHEKQAKRTSFIKQLLKNQPNIDCDVETSANQQLCATAEASLSIETALQQKQNIIQEMQSQLKQLDEEFSSLIRDQHSDVTKLHDELEAAIKAVLQMFEEYSRTLEKSLLSAVEELRRVQEVEIEDLFIQRGASRQKNSVEEVTRQHTFWRSIQNIQESTTLQNRLTKQQLQEDIDNSQLKLFEVQSSYALKVEKLAFNKNDLEAQQDEKVRKLKRYRKLIIRREESLRKIISGFQEQERKSKRVLKNLKRLLARSEGQCKEVELKLQKPSQKYNKKYNSIRSMHEQDIKKIILSINSAEGVIVNEVLGRPITSSVVDPDKLTYVAFMLGNIAVDTLKLLFGIMLFASYSFLFLPLIFILSEVMCCLTLCGLNSSNS